MRWTYIYHVIGTLDLSHVERSAESMARQDFHWDRLVVHNASPLATDDVLARLDTSKFDVVQVIEREPADPPTCAADWERQMMVVAGAERYLSHKADFYLADGVCAALDSLPDGPWFVPFNKFDMKSRCGIDVFRRYASKTWTEAFVLPTTGSYEQHIGKFAVPFYQSPNPDGTMHAYTDEVRGLFSCTDAERRMRWGVAQCIRDLRDKVPFIVDPRFFALHIWHESPDRTDWNKNMFPWERF